MAKKSIKKRKAFKKEEAKPGSRSHSLITFPSSLNELK